MKKTPERRGLLSSPSARTITWILWRYSSLRLTGFRYDLRGSPVETLNSTTPWLIAYIIILWCAPSCLTIFPRSVDGRKTISDIRVFSYPPPIIPSFPSPDTRVQSSRQYTIGIWFKRNEDNKVCCWQASFGVSRVYTVHSDKIKLKLNTTQ